MRSVGRPVGPAIRAEPIGGQRVEHRARLRETLQGTWSLIVGRCRTDLDRPGMRLGCPLNFRPRWKLAKRDGAEWLNVW